MSGRPLDLTQRQVRALCEGARKAGYAVVVEIGKSRVRLIPEEHLDADSERPKVDQTGVVRI